MLNGKRCLTVKPTLLGPEPGLADVFGQSSNVVDNLTEKDNQGWNRPRV